MKKVLILGATGMLGSGVYSILKDKYKLILAVRDKGKIDLLEKAYGDTKKHRVVEFDATKIYEDFVAKKGYPGKYVHDFLKQVGNFDYAINAVGLIHSGVQDKPALAFFVNGALPHILARELGTKLIHITTDCAFDGKTGFPYSEVSPKTPVDIYGLSKSLGEPENCLTLRTSIIGRELEGHTGLLGWFLQQKGKKVSGYRHYWNGITTVQFGKICDQIMSAPQSYPRSGLYHIFSNSVTKYKMLQEFKKKFGVDCTITENKKEKLNRTLTTVKDLNNQLNIPSFHDMVHEL